MQISTAAVALFFLIALSSQGSVSCNYFSSSTGSNDYDILGIVSFFRKIAHKVIDFLSSIFPHSKGSGSGLESSNKPLPSNDKADGSIAVGGGGGLRPLLGGGVARPLGAFVGGGLPPPASAGVVRPEPIVGPIPTGGLNANVNDSIPFVTVENDAVRPSAPIPTGGANANVNVSIPFVTIENNAVPSTALNASDAGTVPLDGAINGVEAVVPRPAAVSGGTNNTSAVPSAGAQPPPASTTVVPYVPVPVSIPKPVLNVTGDEIDGIITVENDYPEIDYNAPVEGRNVDYERYF